MADFFGPESLKKLIEASFTVPMSAIDDSARRVLLAEFASGIVDHPAAKGVPDVAAGLDTAQKIVEEQSIVLLKNRDAVLPLVNSQARPQVNSIAVIGEVMPTVGMISGRGGSAQVDPPGGKCHHAPGQGATHWQDHVWFPTSPLKALRAEMPASKISFDSGQDLAAAVNLAKSADVAIVFAYQWQAEGMDLPNLSLPRRTGRVDREGRCGESPYDRRARDRNGGDHAVGGRRGGDRRGLVRGKQRPCGAGRRSPTGQVSPLGKIGHDVSEERTRISRRLIFLLLRRKNAGQGTGVERMGRRTRRPKYSVSYDEGARRSVTSGTRVAAQSRFCFRSGFGLSYTTYAYSGLEGGGRGRASHRDGHDHEYR